MPGIFEAVHPDDHAPTALILLILLQASLSLVLVCLMSFFLLQHGAAVAIISGVGVHVAGFGTTFVLSYHVPRLLKWWAGSFALVPTLLTPFAGYDYFVHETEINFPFWLGFSISLLAASYLGGIYGVKRMYR